MHGNTVCLASTFKKKSGGKKIFIIHLYTKYNFKTCIHLSPGVHVCSVKQKTFQDAPDYFLLHFPACWGCYSCFLCVSGCVCVSVCLSDPPVTQSPASRLPTPYQARERTRDARMYHSHQFSFASQPLTAEGKTWLRLLEPKFHVKSHFVSGFQQI